MKLPLPEIARAPDLVARFHREGIQSQHEARVMDAGSGGKDCIPRDTPQCDGNHAITAPNGGDTTDCAPSRCADTGVCLATEEGAPSELTTAAICCLGINPLISFSKTSTLYVSRSLVNCW